MFAQLAGRPEGLSAFMTSVLSRIYEPLPQAPQVEFLWGSLNELIGETVFTGDAGILGVALD